MRAQNPTAIIATAALMWAVFWPTMALTNAPLHPAQTAAVMGTSSGISALALGIAIAALGKQRPTRTIRAALTRRAAVMGANRGSTILNALAATHLPFAAVATISNTYPIFATLWMQTRNPAERHRINAATVTIATAGLTGAAMAILSQPGEHSIFATAEQPVRSAGAALVAIAATILAGTSGQAVPAANQALRQRPNVSAQARTGTAAACFGLPSVLSTPLLLAATPLIDHQAITAEEAFITAAYGPMQAAAFTLMFDAMTNTRRADPMSAAFLEAPFAVAMLWSSRIQNELNWGWLIAGMTVTAATMAAGRATTAETDENRNSATPEPPTTPTPKDTPASREEPRNTPKRASNGTLNGNDTAEQAPTKETPA